MKYVSLFWIYIHFMTIKDIYEGNQSFHRQTFTESSAKFHIKVVNTSSISVVNLSEVSIYITWNDIKMQKKLFTKYRPRHFQCIS